MFDTEYHFEELPLSIGCIEIAHCSGTAMLEGENGPHDYGFSVTGIELDGHLINDYRDNRTVQISEKSDDVFHTLLFQNLAANIMADRDAAEHFYAALRDHIHEAA